MSDFTELPGDPLDALLRPRLAPASDAFRQRVLARTTALLWRRRRRQSAARVAALALAACIVAVLGMMYGQRPLPPEPALPAVTAAPRTAVPPAETATALEWEAVDHPEQAATLYRVAGDRYLSNEGDLAGAVRCYGNGLSAGAANDLTIDPGDSWLLMAIKDARQKEKRDANRVQ
jgi:hypothetical protein